MKTELNTVYAADTSPVSLYEYFHISPIKVGVWQQQSASLIGVSCSLGTAEPHCVFFFVVFLSGQLHLSFSLSTGGEDGLKEQREKELIPVQSLNLLLKSIGATLTDVQDVVFKYTTTRCCFFFLMCS